MKEISINELQVNPYTLFGKNWMALTAGTEKDGFNTMTVAWGHLGSIWERGNHRNCLPTAICYVRPGRYTKKYMDKEEYFTLSHFAPKYKKALGYLGSHSGRNEDKKQSHWFNTCVFRWNYLFCRSRAGVYLPQVVSGTTIGNRICG